MKNVWPPYDHSIIWSNIKYTMYKNETPINFEIKWIYLCVTSQDLIFQHHMLWSFCVQWFEVRGESSFCCYWWNCWPSLIKLSFHNAINFGTFCSFIQMYIFFYMWLTGEPLKRTEYIKTFGHMEYIQSNMSYVTFQGNSEIWSHKTGGHLIQV